MAEILAKPKQSASKEIGAHILFGDSIVIDGITDVTETSDKLIVATLNASHTLTLSGENFKLDSLDVTSGKATIRGSVLSLKYSKGHEKLSFLKKMFK